jgi:hypothetical protein
VLRCIIRDLIPLVGFPLPWVERGQRLRVNRDLAGVGRLPPFVVGFVHPPKLDSGVFDRTLVVPMQIDPDGIKAEYNDGLLALFIPRAEQDKPRTIAIK